jgi:hypothetical protein
MNEEKLKLKQNYLDKHVFYGLLDLNNGFDAPGIKYFSESDFAIVLNRVKALRLGIYGIEPWKDGEFYDVTVNQRGDESCTDPSWYIPAFESFKKSGEKLQYAASYYIPEDLLKST